MSLIDKMDSFEVDGTKTAMLCEQLEKRVINLENEIIALKKLLGVKL
jgi:hypothetical protein